MKKKIIGIVLTMMIVFGIGVSIYAYFKKSFDKNHTFTFNSESEAVLIETLDDFYSNIQAVNEEDANSTSRVSLASSRTTIKLNVDLTLTSDVIVTRDCHIDFNGHSIELNGYQFTIRNTYDGVMAIYSSNETGSITESKESSNTINLDTPYSYVLFDTSTITLTNVTRRNIQENEDVLRATVMKFIFANLCEYNVNDFYSIVDNVNAFGNTTSCGMTHDGSHTCLGCVYTYTNLNLIHNFYSEAVTISYESSDTSIVSNRGYISSLGNCELKIVVTTAGGSTTDYVNIHSVLSDSDEGAVCSMVQYFYRYYDAGQDKYVFQNYIMVPKQNSYFNKSLSYKLNGTITTSNADYFTDKGSVYQIALASEITTLTISSGSISRTLNIIAQAEKGTDDDYSYALNIITKLYKNQFYITEESNSTGYSMHTLYTDLSSYGYSKLSTTTPLSYSIEDTLNEGTYIISNNILQYDSTNNAKKPSIDQNIGVKITVPFKEHGADGNEKTITITLPIVYRPKSSGVGFAQFDPYYVYFNNDFTKKTGNYTKESFNISLSYNKSFPTYDFIVYEIGKDADGNTRYTRMTTNSEAGLFYITTSDGKVMQSNHIGDGKAEGLTSLIYTDAAVTNVTINPYYINKEDTKYLFVYIPVNKDSTGKTYYVVGESSTTTSLANISDDVLLADSYKYKSELLIPGIVRCQAAGSSVITEEFADSTLYGYVYNKIYGKTIQANQFIETNMLSMNIAKFDLSSNSSITSLKGINLCTGVAELDLTGTNLSGSGTIKDSIATTMGYISGMKGLTKLILNNTSIYDMTSQNNKLPNTNSDNDFLSILAEGLTNLTDLDLQNNQIYLFTDLSKFASLKNVNVKDNKFTCTYYSEQFTGILAFLGTALDSVFTNIVNAIYGEQGAQNVATFAQLEAYGITVTRNSGGGSIPTEFNQIVKALTTLEYQDKIPQNQNINTVYDSFPTANIYGFPTQFKMYSQESAATSPSSGDNRIDFSFKEIKFSSSNGNSFTMSVTYHYQAYSYSSGWLGIGAGWSTVDDGDGDVTFSYSYEVMRY